MNHPKIELLEVTRSDVRNILSWLENEEIVDSWFGRYTYGDPAHLGYHPAETLEKSAEEWNPIFQNPEHIIFSIYNTEGIHVGESHVAIEESLGDGQISILIGRKEWWDHGYGSQALKETIKNCFEVVGLFRVWADIPEYNTRAIHVFENLGFVHEGSFRKSRPHEGARHDSVVMGMLSTEYSAKFQSEAIIRD